MIDKNGDTARLENSPLEQRAVFAEAPDGTVWALAYHDQTRDLIRLKYDAGTISLIERHSLGDVENTGGACCDLSGRVWIVQQPRPGEFPTELIRLATSPHHVPPRH